jgi:serine/threonine-protein kinase HipA
MKAGLNIKTEVEVCLGKAAAAVGRLIYVKQGRREHAIFAYENEWLRGPGAFQLSPDLPLGAGYQTRKAASEHDSIFHFALADTQPDAWGRRIIARDHAKRRRADALPALTEIDYLLAVDDFSRIGALRLRDQAGRYLRTAGSGKRSTPALIDLKQVYQASRAVEQGAETEQDLRYLQGKGTSLGGMRPKCTVLDDNGQLAIGKFPSVADTRSVTRGEVLALQIAREAGIDAASSRIVCVDGVPIAVVQRFDRVADGGRIPYLSAASMLQASREEDRSYSEIADLIRSYGYAPTQDLQQLWRRMVFNLLITNVDDHLQNQGFLHVEHGQWRLAPAFDLNPFPDKDRESKTWLSEEDGPVATVAPLMAMSMYFALNPAEARAVLSEVYRAVANWRHIGQRAEVGLTLRELDDFAPAFEHEQMREARELSRRGSTLVGQRRRQV